MPEQFSTKSPRKAMRFRIRSRYILLYSLIVILAAQINVNLFLNNFKISIGIVLLPVFIFLWDDFPLIPVTILSGLGVFLSRAAINWLQKGSTEKFFSDYAPEAVFYLVFGLLLYLYVRKSKTLLARDRSFLLLIVMDYVANLSELLLRFGQDAFSPKTQLSILLVALSRTAAVWAIVTFLRQYHLVLLKQEHADRYQRLILLISKLNGEVIWMKKNTSLMEETMNTSYRLYNDLKQSDTDSKLSKTALSVAKDIHEIKKEYLMILRGISEALDLNLEDDGMKISEILRLLENTITATFRERGKNVSFQIDCQKQLYTDKHYFLMSIFRNLFTNAIEAGQDDQPHISCTLSEGHSQYCFTVQDNGPGIDEEDLEQIFQPGFSTKINYTTGEVSRGLGLNLVQDLVENQFHGTISVTSRPGCTCFTICIPKNELKVV